MRCRKNYRDLDAAERDRLVQALHHAKAAGVVDQFASEHEAHFSHGIHTSSHFLPWHREFIRRFEDALRTYHPQVTLPYWNSVVDRSPSDSLWDGPFLGQFDSAWNLDRALGSDTLPTEGQLNTALGRGTYDTFWPDLEVNLHNAPHRWVAGKMAQRDSPHDPVFYLHHCWIDLLWAQWQLGHPTAPFVSSGAGAGLTDPLMGYTTTPADVLDHRTINVYRYPPGFVQDTPRVTLDTPVVNFIEVPAGETRMGAAVFSLDACETLHFTVVNGPVVTAGPPGTFGLPGSPGPADPHVDEKGRVWFTYTATAAGDVSEGAATIRCDETGDQFAVALRANTIARPTAAMVMVLDRSNSMTFDSGVGAGVTRADVLRFSAPTAVVVLEDTNAMAVCSFDHDAHPGIPMTEAAGAGKLTISAAIQSYAPNPNGWTSIGEGVALAHGIVAPVTDHEVKALVVLTDGEENHGPHARRYIHDVEDLIASLNGRVYAIGLGRAEILNPVALQALCSGNRGYLLMTGDLTPDATYRVAKYYQQIFAGVTNHDIVLDPQGYVGPGPEVRIPFWLADTDISAKAFLLAPAPHAIRFRLETPDGDIIDPAVASAHPTLAFEAGHQVALYRLGLPVPLGGKSAHAGRWYARLGVENAGYKRYLSSLEDRSAGRATAAAHGILYNFNVHAYSNLRMRATLSQTSNVPGASLGVRAVLTEYGLPVAGRAHCRAELTRPDGAASTLPMPEVQPGAFETSFTAHAHGIYPLRILAEGRTLRGLPFTREQLLTGAVWRGGDDAPTVKDDPDRDRDRVCSLVACVLRSRGVLGVLSQQGIDPEELRRCLAEYCRKPSPGEPSHLASSDVEGRLRVILRDENTLRAVMEMIRPALE
ncbi:tyrosinase [Anaeromyxobacter dehalogenans 2CP-1]|uniref:Tyrosinase n=1 Tax=Anaeromyxobacter dehalogenans (strain ATCC BAA-258 / DSM 21875 / 2CP-1) TaxID=455488 RepID=B8J766_ANAD2|nr:tyrosinase family protein [Anaeromyxobacter dehalogenans]ACL65256.1 tyrosinase [Anaeromyxobacter dehalogenans 2CP-1]